MGKGKWLRLTAQSYWLLKQQNSWSTAVNSTNIVLQSCNMELPAQMSKFPCMHQWLLGALPGGKRGSQASSEEQVRAGIGLSQVQFGDWEDLSSSSVISYPTQTHSQGCLQTFTLEKSMHMFQKTHWRPSGLQKGKKNVPPPRYSMQHMLCQWHCMLWAGRK